MISRGNPMAAAEVSATRSRNCRTGTADTHQSTALAARRMRDSVDRRGPVLTRPLGIRGASTVDDRPSVDLSIGFRRLGRLPQARPSYPTSERPASSHMVDLVAGQAARLQPTDAWSRRRSCDLPRRELVRETTLVDHVGQCASLLVHRSGATPVAAARRLLVACGGATMSGPILATSASPTGHRDPRERSGPQMPAPARRQGLRRAIQETPYSPRAGGACFPSGSGSQRRR